MRDNHEQLPELLEAFKENENYFGIVAISKADKIFKYKIGILEDEYRVLKKMYSYKPFDSLDTTPYRYFFVPSIRKDGDKTYCDIRVEQGRTGKQFEFQIPERLIANLKWFFELENLEDAIHLLVENKT